MNKFLRKIRQRLIAENRFTKYMLYAFGEIVLVVIGILIAVRINSWVIQNKTRADNEVFLAEMISELELNKKRMRKLSYGDLQTSSRGWRPLSEVVENCDSLLQLSYIGFGEEHLPFVLKVRLNAGGSFLNIHNSVYEELINTGKLYNLDSNELITSIKEYYKRCEREDEYNRVNSDGVRDGFALIKSSLLKMRMDFERDSAGFSLQNYPWYFDKHSEPYQNLQIALRDIRGGQYNNLKKMIDIEAYSDSLIAVIHQELKLNYDYEAL